MGAQLPAATRTGRRSAPPPPGLRALVGRLRTALRGPAVDTERIAALVAAEHLSPEALDESHRRGNPERLTSQIVYAEDTFSVVALALLPGQRTTIHDHLTWGVVAVLSGTEDETQYRDRGDHLDVLRHVTNHAGSVTAFTPPGDIHQVRNERAEPAISLHVYGADLRGPGSSIRRTYDLPVLD